LKVGIWCAGGGHNRNKAHIGTVHKCQWIDLIADIRADGHRKSKFGYEVRLPGCPALPAMLFRYTVATTFWYVSFFVGHLYEMEPKQFFSAAHEKFS
jgi:hypothetical protein